MNLQIVKRITWARHSDGVSDRRADWRPFEFRGGHNWFHRESGDISGRGTTLRSGDQELRGQATTENAPNAGGVIIKRLKNAAAGAVAGISWITRGVAVVALDDRIHEIKRLPVVVGSDAAARDVLFNWGHER